MRADDSNLQYDKDDLDYEEKPKKVWCLFVAIMTFNFK